MALPDFLIIGAMKCGTSTLQTQLARQRGVFMTTPKEPNFFSDDAVWARGLGWYESLFDAAAPGALKGEASTHYTKLPTYPDCADRLARTLPHVRLIYMIRDPFDRLVSHYIHEWTMNVIREPLEAALERRPELVEYGCYGMQIAPYVARYGAGRILVLALEDLNRDPQGALERVFRFLGRDDAPVWREEDARQNASAERVRRLPLQEWLIEHPIAAAVRRRLVPQRLRDAVKDRLRMKARPALSPAARERLATRFAEDRKRLEAFFPALRRETAG